MALLDDGDLAYMRATQAEARPTTAQLIHEVPDAPSGRDSLGGRSVKVDPAPQDNPVAIRIDSEPDPPQALATEFGVHLVRITADLVTIVPGDRLKVSSTEIYKVVSDG